MIYFNKIIYLLLLYSFSFTFTITLAKTSLNIDLSPVFALKIHPSINLYLSSFVHLLYSIL